tara:strand:- start:65 stop:385 length:321 start_codon:yes stop_codon:yes gene_type:complete
MLDILLITFFLLTVVSLFILIYFVKHYMNTVDSLESEIIDLKNTAYAKNEILNDIAIEKRKKVKLIIKELKAIDESILKVNPSYLSERLGQTKAFINRLVERIKEL